MTTYFIDTEVSKCDALIIPVWEGKSFDAFVKAIDEQNDGMIQRLLESKDFEAKTKQLSLLYPAQKKTPRIVLVGLGEQKNISVRNWKQAVGAAVIAAQGKKATKLNIVLPAYIVSEWGARIVGRESIAAVELANYSYDEHKAKDDRVKPLKEVTFVGEFSNAQMNGMENGMDDGEVIAEATNFTRELGNIPPSVMTPTLLAEKATEVAKEHRSLKVKVLSRPDMERLGMGCLLGVSSGSAEEPKFIILEYSGAAKKQKPTVLVGKGITFDSGGLSLKPGDYMCDMKFDMLGAATVLGTVKAAAALGLKKNIVGLMPSCENMPSGSSYRPDDILKAMNGKTVEILNTDAEGRLILADGLSYASKKYDAKEVIDFATLTGACGVALGNERSGLFTNEERMVEKLSKSADAVGEHVWRLPLGEEYTEAMKSKVADIKNIGGVGHPRYAGASTAAAFLQQFVDAPWAHFDLSSGWADKNGKPWQRGGANGSLVQTMVEYLR